MLASNNIELNNNNNNNTDDKANESITNKTQLTPVRSFRNIYILNNEQYIKRLKEPIFQEIILGLSEKAANKRTEKIDAMIERLAQMTESEISQFAASVNISFNKKYINKSIHELYEDFNMYSVSPHLSFPRIIELLYSEERSFFRHIMTSKYSSLYTEYLHSARFARDLSEVRRKEGERYSYLFEYISLMFVKYFQLEREGLRAGRRRRFVVAKG